MAKVGFIGLGNIGRGICGNLLKAGHEMTVFDVSEAARDKWKDKAYVASDAGEVCDRSDYIFLSLPNSEIVQANVEVFLERGIKGKTIIDTSTSYPVSTRALYEKVKNAGGNLVDAALMAGPDEAEKGILDVVVGGDKEVVDDLQFLFDTYCKSVKYVGKAGNGHLAKIAMNFCGLSEALLFAHIFPVMQKFGFEPKELYDILDCETLDNWIFRFYGDKYVNKNYRLDFALALGLKDLTYVKRLFDELNIPGFMLDGALDLCRVTLQSQKENEILDFSYPCQTLYDYVGKA